MGRSGHAVHVSCLLSLGLLIFGMDASAAAGDAPRAGVEQDDVDLYLMRGGAALIPGGVAERAMTVQNNGRDMVDGIDLYYTAPIYINIDETKGLPAGCAMYYQNKDFHVPEIVKCTLGPLKSGERHELSLPIAIFAGAPAVQTYGAAIVRPAHPDLDPERNMVDNVASPGGAIALPPNAQGRARTPRAEGRPRLTVQSTAPLVSPDKSSDSSYRVFNLGAGPAENARLIVVTPLYVNTSTAGELPGGCSMPLRDPDPAVPEIVDCAVGNLDPGQALELRIPVKAVPGGPHRQVFGTAIAFVQLPTPAKFASDSPDGDGPEQTSAHVDDDCDEQGNC